MIVKCEVLDLVFGQKACHEAVLFSYEHLSLNLVFEEPHDVKLLLDAVSPLCKSSFVPVTLEAGEESANDEVRCLVALG